MGSLPATPERQFTWMYGLSGTQGLEMAQQLGLNTIYLPTTNTVDSVEASRSLAQAAQKAGLQVIIALPTLSAKAHPVDPDAPEYCEEVGARVRAVVRQLAGEPGVTAWAMADYVERELRYTPQGFQAYLQTRYDGLDTLNASWQAQFGTWAEVTPAAAREVDAAKPYGVGRASVELANYQAEALRRLLAFWAEQVRTLDSTRPLFTGRLALYRSLVCVPEEYDFVVPEMPADVMEPDYLSQNVQAVDLARQGGAFRVIPSLRLPVPPDPNYRSGVTVGYWLREAQLHGARGVALDGSERVAASTTPSDVLKTLTEQIQAVKGSFNLRPRPCLCVLYETYAEGLKVMQVPAHGYLLGLAPGEPSVLMGALRLGSKYGLVDYLSPARLVNANLEGYSAILAPTALSLPAEVQGRLRAYVEHGGRVVSDLGAGMYETGSWDVLPPDVARMSGVVALREIQNRTGDLRLSRPIPLFPSLRPPLSSRGLKQEEKPPRPGQVVRHTGTPQELQGATFLGPVALAEIAETARLVAVVSAEPKSERQPARWAGIVAQPRGRGWTIFCTGSLWARWDPLDPFFMGFHADLWQPRAQYILHQPGLWPQAVEMSTGEASVHLLNVSGRPRMAEVTALSASNHLYEGAFTEVASPLYGGVAPGAVVLTAQVPADRLVTLRQQPICVWPLGGEAYAHLREYEAQRISLEIAGPGARLTTGLDREPTLTGGQPTQVVVRISPGEYAVEPGSWHQLTIKPTFGQQSGEQIQADDKGQLAFQVSGDRVKVEIVPVAPAPAALSTAADS